MEKKQKNKKKPLASKRRKISALVFEAYIEKKKLKTFWRSFLVMQNGTETSKSKSDLPQFP